MPVVRLPNAKWLYFAHVPKAAGTAVEYYLAQRFGPLGFLDSAFARRSAAEAWTAGPPQHMPDAVRQALLPDALFDGFFATVRHPALRLRSAFLFARNHEGTLPPTMPFDLWVHELPRILTTDPGAFFGHIRPMCAYVPPGAAIFRVEDQLDGLVEWLDEQAGNSGGARQVAPQNRFRDVMAAKSEVVEDIHLTDALCAQIADIYADDFARFGYTPQVHTA